MNTTNSNHLYLRNSIGAGISFKNLLLKDRKYNIILGVEVNHQRKYFYQITYNKFIMASNVTYSYTEVKVPANVRAYFNFKRKIWIDTGPYVSLNIGGKEKGDFFNRVSSQKVELSRSVIISPFNLGGNLNLSYKLKMATSSLILTCGYSYGLFPIKRLEGQFYSTYLSAAIGYGF